MLLEIKFFIKKEKEEEKKIKSNQNCIESGLSPFLFLQQKM